MSLERPQLADQPPPKRPALPSPASDFRRRLSYYLSGVVIGTILVVPILSAKCAQRKAASQSGPPGSGAATP